VTNSKFYDTYSSVSLIQTSVVTVLPLCIQSTHTHTHTHNL